MKSFPEQVSYQAHRETILNAAWSIDEASHVGDGVWRDWDDLNSRLFQSHPLLDSRFIRPLLEHFGTGTELLLTCRAGARLVGAAILVKTGIGQWETFLPSQAPIAPVLLPSTELVLDGLRRLPGFPLTVDFRCQDPLCSPFDLHNDKSTVATTAYADTMAITLDEAFEVYWKSRTNKLRNNVARYLRRMDKDGIAGRLEWLSSVPDLERAVARYGELESAGWKGRNGTAIRDDNKQGRFYASVASRFGASGDAHACEFRAGDDLIASRLMISNTSVVVMLKTTYDETLSEYAPGRVLLYRLLEDLAGRTGPKRIEFYTKATADQLAWATESRPIFHARVFRWPALKASYRYLKRLRRAAAVTVRADSEGADRQT